MLEVVESESLLLEPRLVLIMTKWLAIGGDNMACVSLLVGWLWYLVLLENWF